MVLPEVPPQVTVGRMLLALHLRLALLVALPRVDSVVTAGRMLLALHLRPAQFVVLPRVRLLVTIFLMKLVPAAVPRYLPILMVR